MIRTENNDSSVPRSTCRNVLSDRFEAHFDLENHLTNFIEENCYGRVKESKRSS
ncbi:MAG: hypothetical protein K5669_04295 [Lachnospiraceae bacterium]|nr:hypothetical protein [Lachnospiraceae bacterium]